MKKNLFIFILVTVLLSLTIYLLEVYYDGANI